VSDRRLPPFVAALFFTLRDLYNTVDLYAYSEARYSSVIAFLPIPPAFDAPVRGGGFRSEYRHPVWYGKTRMVWLPDGEKISKICLFVLT